MALDERLRDELERAARPADPSGLYENLIRRRERRRIARKVQSGLLAVVVIAGSLAGVYGLSLVFREGPPREPAAPAVSNGGIVFVRANDRGQHLYLVEADGSEVRQLTHGDVFDEAPDWSPDGTRLAFVRWDDVAGRVSLMVMEVATGETRAVAGGPCAQPDWSPDGASIAFSSRVGGNGVIATVPATGGEPRVVADDGFLSAEDPDWSPDGSEIVFEANRPDAPSSWDIYGAAPDGSDLRNITNTPSPDESEVWPRWSPDGITILVGRGPGEMTQDDTHLYFLITPDGRTIRQINDGASFDQEPNWSPDGRFLVFDSDRSDETEVWTLELATGELTRVTQGGGFEPAWQPLPDGEEVSPQPSPSPSPTQSPAAEGPQNIGLGFPVCNVTSVNGMFAPGVSGTAYVATKTGDVGCPELGDGLQVVAVDVSGDGLADVDYGPLTGCDPWCSAFAAPDVDGDGTDELLIQNIQFSIAGLRLYEVRADPAKLFPVTVSTPGYPEGGLPPGAEPQLWIGGDGFQLDTLRCMATPTGRVLIQTSASQVPPDSTESVWRATATWFSLDPDGTVSIVDVGTFDEPFDENPSFAQGNGVCGARLPGNG